MAEATGGKYWAFNKHASIAKSHGISGIKFTLLFVLPWIVVGGSVFAALLWMNPMSIQKLPAVADGYSVSPSNISGVMFAIILGSLFGVAGGLGFLAVKFNPPVWTIFPMTALFLLMCVINMTVLKDSQGASSNSPNTISRWAQETYGYDLQSGIEDNGRNADTVEVINKNGEHLTVNVFRSDNATYLYENTVQLEKLLERINAEKSAL